MDRRFCVYFLLEASAATGGTANESAKSLVRCALDDWQKNPYALESLHVCVIAYNSETRKLVPLTPVWDLDPLSPLWDLDPLTPLWDTSMPSITASGEGDTGGGFRFLVDSVLYDAKSTDWRPALVHVSTSAAAQQLAVSDSATVDSIRWQFRHQILVDHEPIHFDRLAWDCELFIEEVDNHYLSNLIRTVLEYSA